MRPAQSTSKHKVARTAGRLRQGIWVVGPRPNGRAWRGRKNRIPDFDRPPPPPNSAAALRSTPSAWLTPCGLSNVFTPFGRPRPQLPPTIAIARKAKFRNALRIGAAGGEGCIQRDPSQIIQQLFFFKNLPLTPPFPTAIQC